MTATQGLAPRLYVVKGSQDSNIEAPTDGATRSSITIEIDELGRLGRFDVRIRKEDCLQLIQGLAMAHLRALDMLMQH